MGKYFLRQAKRLGRYLPGAVLAALVLMGSLLAVFSLMVRQDAQSEKNQKFAVAVVGYTDDVFLQMGLKAIGAFDSSRFALDILQMEQKDAQKALERGEISAYVAIPENFVDEAMHGNILPLNFVSTTGAAGLVSIFKHEITDVISQILLAAQKGVFGMADAVEDYGQELGNRMDDMSIRYVEHVFVRDRTYRLTELGIADALGLEGYLLCGLGVLFLLLCCLPFAPLMIRKDTALPQMLAARGRSAFGQSTCDFAAYTLALFVTVLVLLIPVEVLSGEDLSFFTVLGKTVPVTILVAAFSYLLYSLSTDLVGGILLQFFTTLAMCFVSGCIYPVYFFPVQVQKLAAWLPAGMARSQLAGCITGKDAGLTPVWLLCYSLVFFFVGSGVAIRRMKGVRT